MLQRFYVHNFRCLENFELNLKDTSSALLIGKNGVGKSTVSFALEIFQQIGRGINKVGLLLHPKDFSHSRMQIPMRFEVEVWLDNKLFKYLLAFDLPDNFKELRVLEEQLSVDNELIYSRQQAQVTFYSTLKNQEAKFLVDWHLIALPIIQDQSERLRIFKTWLAQMIILAPIPRLMTGESNNETLEPKKDGSNFSDWISGVLSRYPAAYTQLDKYLREVMPDIQDFQNEQVGKDSKNMVVQFEANNLTFKTDFEDLSDGEKCFFLCALVLAANKFYAPLFCFWDEPDNYLSLSEVGQFIMALRRSFKNNSQILATSHNEEAIRKFSDENIFIFDRKSHLEPTLIRKLSELAVPDDLIGALIRGDVGL